MSGEFEYPHYMDEMSEELKEMWERCNEKQKLFIVFYAQTENARQSYIRAGYSKQGARQSGYNLLTNPYIKPVVDWMMKYIIDNALDTSISTASERMKILTEMTRATVEDFTNDEGNIDINATGANPANVKELTNSYDKDGNREVKIKMYSSVDAIKELNKMQGSYAADKLRHVDKDDNDVEPPAPLIIKTKEMSSKDLDDIGFVES